MPYPTYDVQKWGSSMFVMSSVPHSMPVALSEPMWSSPMPFYSRLESTSFIEPGLFPNARARMSTSLPQNSDLFVSFCEDGTSTGTEIFNGLGLIHFTDAVYEPPGYLKTESYCSCKEQRRDILNRQVSDLITKNGCLEINAPQLLGWYIMLSAEDRKIIKEYGSLAEYLKNNPAVEIINNFVYLKDEELMERESMVSIEGSGSFASCIDELSYTTSSEARQGMDDIPNASEMAIPACKMLGHCDGILNSIETVDQQIKHSLENIAPKPVPKFDPDSGSSLIDVSLDTAFDIYKKQQDAFSSVLEDTKEEQNSQHCEIGCDIGTWERDQQCVEHNMELEHSNRDVQNFSFQDKSSHVEESAFETLETADISKPLEFLSVNSIEQVSGNFNYADNFEKTSFFSTYNSVNVVTSDEEEMSPYRTDQYNRGDTYLMETAKCEQVSASLHCPSFHKNTSAEDSVDIAQKIPSDLATDTRQIIKKVQHLSSVDRWMDDGKLKENLLQQYDLEPMKFSLDSCGSSPDICEDSYLSALSGSSSTSFDSLLTFDNPALSVSNDGPYYEEIAAQDVPPLSGFRYRTCKKCAADEPKATMSQIVDASSDFRTCFTTSRSTSMEKALFSKASNTEVTLISKCASKRWQMKKHRSIACNTDPMLTKGSVQEVASQTDFVPAQEPQHSVPLINSTEQLSENPQRMKEISNRDKKSAWSPCCMEVVERALKAELQLLNTYHWMCRDRCWQMYKHVVEEKQSFNSDLTGNHDELGFNLTSTLEELKKKYENLKEKLLSGTPLDRLPQLSIEVKNSVAFTDYIPSVIMKADIQADVEKFQAELENQRKEDVDVTTLQQNVTLSKPALSNSCHVTKCESSLGAELADVDDQEDTTKSNKTLDVTDGWFDAKEELTFNTTCAALHIDKPHIVSPEEVPIVEPEIKMVDTSGCELEKGAYVHVQGLASSVCEDELMSHFLKYQVSKVFIEQFSVQHSYAILLFNTAHDAEMAVEEMDGKAFNGKGVKVRLIKVAAETGSKENQINHNFEMKLLTEDLPVTNINPLSFDHTSQNSTPYARPSQELPAMGRFILNPNKAAFCFGPSSHPSKVNDPRTPVKTTPLPLKAPSFNSTQLMPSTFPPSWSVPSVPSSYHSPYCQVPGNPACNLMIASPEKHNWIGPGASQAPWTGHRYSQIPMSGHNFHSFPWQLSSFSQGSWPLTSWPPPIVNVFGSVQTPSKPVSSSKNTSKPSSSNSNTLTSSATKTVCPVSFTNKSVESGTTNVTELPPASSKVNIPSNCSSKATTSSYSNVSSSTAPPKVVSVSTPTSKKIAIPKVRITASGLRRLANSTTAVSKVTSSASVTSTMLSANCTPATSIIHEPVSVATIAPSLIAPLTTVSNSVSARDKVPSYTHLGSKMDSCTVTSTTVTVSAPRMVPHTPSEPFLIKVPAKNSIEMLIDPFMSQKTVNLSSLDKLMKKLTHLHPEANRKSIVEALVMVRAKNHGVLTGLAHDDIVERASSVLLKSTAVSQAEGAQT